MSWEVITGRDGYVNGIPCIQSWGFNRTAATSRYAASCTDRGTGVTKGNINETGAMAGIGGNPSVTPGNNITFKGVADNTVSDNIAYDGTVLVTGLHMECDQQAGGLITWSSTLGVQGSIVKGTVGAADATFSEAQGASIVHAPEIYDGATWVAVDGFKKWSFDINALEKTYVQNGATLRKGGNLEAQISIDVFARNMDIALYQPNVLQKVRLYIDATTFWLFEWIRFGELTGLTVNRGTQDLLGYTINGMWSSVSGTNLGHITRPNGVNLFGT